MGTDDDDDDWESETGKAAVSSEVAIQNWVTTGDVLVPVNFKFKMDFKVPKDFGTPGAIIVKNRHVHEFLLQAFAIQTPDGKVTSFVTESWVYNTNLHGGRIFFSNQVNHSEQLSGPTYFYAFVSNEKKPICFAQKTELAHHEKTSPEVSWQESKHVVSIF